MKKLICIVPLVRCITCAIQDLSRAVPILAIHRYTYANQQVCK